MLKIEGCQSGNAKTIHGLSQEGLVALLEGDEPAGTKVAAFKVLRDQERRDKYGIKLLKENLNSAQVECVLSMMSENALRRVIDEADLPNDPVRVFADNIYIDRSRVRREEDKRAKQDGSLF